MVWNGDFASDTTIYSRGVGVRVGKNMRSALKHPQSVDQYVQGEIAAGSEMLIFGASMPH